MSVPETELASLIDACVGLSLGRAPEVNRLKEHLANVLNQANSRKDITVALEIIKHLQGRIGARWHQFRESNPARFSLRQARKALLRRLNHQPIASKVLKTEEVLSLLRCSESAANGTVVPDSIDALRCIAQKSGNAYVGLPANYARLYGHLPALFVLNPFQEEIIVAPMLLATGHCLVGFPLGQNASAIALSNRQSLGMLGCDAIVYDMLREAYVRKCATNVHDTISVFMDVPYYTEKLFYRSRGVITREQARFALEEIARRDIVWISDRLPKAEFWRTDSELGRASSLLI